MSGASRGAGALVVALVLVTGALVPVLAGTAVADHETHENASDGDAEGEYALETLRSRGRLPSDAPTATRALGSGTTLWVEHAPTGFLQPDTPENRVDLEPGTKVRRDSVYLRSSRPWDAESQDVELVVVYYETESRTRTVDNETITETVAVNQTIDRQEVTLPSGYSTTEVDLRRYDEPTNVAMFIAGEERDVQWAFKQVSPPASQSVGISTLGGAIKWAFIWMFLPFALTTLGILWIDRKLIKTAGAGPQYKTSEYVGLAFFGGFFALLFAYEWLVDVIARAPWALGIVGGLGFGLLVIELFSRDTFKDLFVRFDLEDVNTREDGSGIMQAEATEVKLVDREDSEPMVVEDGIRPFLARVKGAVPTLDTGPLRRETQLEVDGPWRQLHLVDPTADAALEYESPEWELDVVEFDREVDAEGLAGELLELVPRIDVVPFAIGLSIIYAGWSLAEAFVGAGVIGLLPSTAIVLWWWASPSGGRAVTSLAPIHFDSVVANVLTFAEGLEEYADRDYYRRRFHQEQGKNLAQRRAEREDSEQSRMEAVMNRLAPEPSSIDERDDQEDVAEPGRREVPGDD